MIFIQLFITFFLIGALTIGGGYAMLSLIQHQVVVVHGWITESAFTDIIAISQMTPGPIGINSATYIGYSVLKSTGAGEILCVLGSTTATFAAVLPSFIIMLGIVRIYQRIKDNKVFQGTMTALKPTVVGLIGSAALVLIFNINIGQEGGYSISILRDNFPDWKSWLICAAAFVSAVRFKVHPIPILLCAGLAGVLLY